MKNYCGQLQKNIIVSKSLILFYSKYFYVQIHLKIVQNTISAAGGGQ